MEAGQVYDLEKNGKKIIPNVFTGHIYQDQLMFLDPSTSENGQPSVQGNIKFMSTFKAEKPFNT